MKFAIIATNLLLMYRKSKISDHRAHSKHKQKMMHYIFRLPNHQLATCHHHYQRDSDSQKVQDKRSPNAFQAQAKDDALHFQITKSPTCNLYLSLPIWQRFTESSRWAIFERIPSTNEKFCIIIIYFLCFIFILFIIVVFLFLLNYKKYIYIYS